jgi:hypothetical protein
MVVALLSCQNAPSSGCKLIYTVNSLDKCIISMGDNRECLLTPLYRYNIKPWPKSRVDTKFRKIS